MAVGAMCRGQHFREGFAERAVVECGEILLANSLRPTSKEPIGHTIVPSRPDFWHASEVR